MFGTQRAEFSKMVPETSNFWQFSPKFEKGLYFAEN